MTVRVQMRPILSLWMLSFGLLLPAESSVADEPKTVASLILELQTGDEYTRQDAIARLPKTPEVAREVLPVLAKLHRSIERPAGAEVQGALLEYSKLVGAETAIPALLAIWDVPSKGGSDLDTVIRARYGASALTPLAKEYRTRVERAAERSARESGGSAQEAIRQGRALWKRIPSLTAINDTIRNIAEDILKDKSFESLRSLKQASMELHTVPLPSEPGFEPSGSFLDSVITSLEIQQTLAIGEDNARGVRRVVEPPTLRFVPPMPRVVQRYPTVEAPTRVVMGQEFAVQASLTEVLLTPEVSTAPKTLSLPKQSKWMLEVVLTGRGFDFRDGRNTSLIELPRDGDSTVALFHLTAHEAGESTRSIYASFYHKSHFLFRVSRPISVIATSAKAELAAPAATVADANPFMLQPRGMGPGLTKAQLRGMGPGLTKAQLRGKGPDLAVEIISGNILIHARGFQPTNIAYTPPTGLTEFLQERYARLATVAGRGVWPVDRQSARDTAKGIGREVYRRFAPPSFKKAFWSLVDRWGEDFRTIQIYSDQPLLPWELMVPGRGDKPEERDHLSLEFQISRWHAREDDAFVASPPQSLDLEELVVVAPRYDPPLKSVEQEIQSIQSFPFADVRLVRGQKTKLREVFSRLPRGILHFAGHGVILQNDTQGTTYAILLEGDRKLTLDEWKGMFSRDRRRHPFVFFNACDIGRTQKVVNFVDGWAPAMLDIGASGYVGALWPVADAKAAIFARRFYEALEKGLRRGDARVLNAIGEARKLYQETGDPTFLAYVYYGDNELTMKPSSSTTH